jgi:hypothetical protein
MINLLEVIDNPEAVALYFMAPFRGLSGENATEEEINRNIADGLGVASWLRGHFPGVVWIIPHEHEILARGMYKKERITSADIIAGWLWVLSRPGVKGGVLWDGKGTSAGMQAEENYLDDLRKPVCTIEETGDEAQREIEQMISEIL